MKRLGAALKLLVVAVMAAVMTGLSELFGRPREAVWNGTESGTTTHEDGRLTREIEDEHALRHLLVTYGTDPETQVTLNGAADIPLGAVADEGEAGEKKVVELLGGTRTRKLRAAGAFAPGPVFAAADGRISDAGAVQVGKALTASVGADDLVEVITVQTF